MKKRMLSFLFVLCILCARSTVYAMIIDFNGLAGTPFPGWTAESRFSQGLDAPVTIDGYTFHSPDWNHIISATHFSDDSADYPYNGTDFMHPISSLTITRTDGSDFSFISLDITTWWDPPNDPLYGSDNEYTFTCVFTHGGPVVSRTITLDTLANRNDQDGNDFEYFIFSDFTGLSQLTIDGSNNSYKGFVIDNLEVTHSEVPVPTTIVLLGWGLIGLAGVRRMLKSHPPGRAGGLNCKPLKAVFKLGAA